MNKSLQVIKTRCRKQIGVDFKADVETYILAYTKPINNVTIVGIATLLSDTDFYGYIHWRSLIYIIVKCLPFITTQLVERRIE